MGRAPAKPISPLPDDGFRWRSTHPTAYYGLPSYVVRGLPALGDPKPHRQRPHQHVAEIAAKYLDLAAPVKIVRRHRHPRMGENSGADSDIDKRDDGRCFHRPHIP